MSGSIPPYGSCIINPSDGLLVTQNLMNGDSYSLVSTIDPNPRRRMRASTRLLAQTSKYLEPGRPTGLTGLLTHASPRTALLYNYTTTLEKLAAFPSHSVYAQSTKALTKHRLNIIESIRPAGLEQWQQRTRQLMQTHPEAIREIKAQSGGVNLVYKIAAAKEETNAERLTTKELDAGEEYSEAHATVAKYAVREDMSAEELAAEGLTAEDLVSEEQDEPIELRIEPEPALTTEQIDEIETKIGAGLIEEVIRVAEAENALASHMFEHRVWEDLEVKPTEAQWAYYERDAHVGKASTS